MDKQVFYIFDHNENESFQIIGLEHFLEWLNDTDNDFSFSLKGFDFDKRRA